jgi:hypothetical protein
VLVLICKFHHQIGFVSGSSKLIAVLGKVSLLREATLIPSTHLRSGAFHYRIFIALFDIISSNISQFTHNISPSAKVLSFSIEQTGSSS